ncbi:MAG TPA: winged helix-turn-helix domain-containing protein, partial [Herpetosiphonaceae bacterium]|nr:winged helix-turn-helix domain-containing protein [Herpetosiphonaceae bacterium]
MVTLGTLRIDVQQRRLWRDNIALHLTPTEWSVLLALLRHRGSLVTHDMLLHQVWGNAHGANADYVHVYMNRLRRKLEADPANPQLLVTEPGSGYRLLMPATGVSTRPAEHTRLVLPPQLTSFIGREADLQAVAALLARPDVRLVSLTGTGGVGKTRLAVEVAARLASQWRYGVVFVDLAPIDDRNLILPAIARTLGIEGQSEQELANGLRTTLREQQMLLVLDNVEHLPVAALVAGLLAWAPELTVLVTSRVRLGMQGEHAYTVRPLAPNSAVALFVARAQAAAADFSLTAENASAISAICTLLDSLPLAIELAAARSAVLPPETLLTRLLP